MKKLQFLAWPKLCTAALLGAGALFMASCAKDELSGDSFNGTYGGYQLSAPDASSISVTKSSDRLNQTITWNTVNGALSYIVNVSRQWDDNEEVVVDNKVVRGNSITIPRKSMSKYTVSIKTAYNEAEQNTGSTTAAEYKWEINELEINIPTGTNFAEYFKDETIAQKSKGHPMLIFLEPGGQYTMTESLDMTGVEVSIIGNDAGNKSVITLGENSEGTAASFYTDSPLALENVEINFNLSEGSNGKPMILLNTTPTCEAINSYYRIESISLNNVKVNNLKNSIFYDNNTKYCVVDLRISNSILKLATTEVKNDALISFQSGGAKDFTVENSTIYGNNAVAKYFLRYQNGARIDRYGFTEDDTWSFTYQNNTFYGLLKEDGQWGNYDGIVGKPAQGVVTINKNIWYNCDPQTMRRMLKQIKFAAFTGVYKMADNTFWRDGGAADQEEYTNKSEITTEPMFVAPAEGDFTLNACEQMTKGCGDPRWIK